MLAGKAPDAGEDSMADTHIGVRVEDNVLLQWSAGGTAIQGPVRILPDGERINDFAIPDKHILAITDLEWRVNTASDVDGQTIEVFLHIKSPTNFVSHPYVARILISKGFGYLSDRLVSPMLVDSSVAFAQMFTPGPNFGPGAVNVFGFILTLRGYLLRAQPGGGPPAKRGR